MRGYADTSGKKTKTEPQKAQQFTAMDNMKTIMIQIKPFGPAKADWVFPVRSHSRALFQFLTSGTIGVSWDRWQEDMEPVLKALGWWWTIAPTETNK